MSETIKNPESVQKPSVAEDKFVDPIRKPVIGSVFVGEGDGIKLVVGLAQKFLQGFAGGLAV